MAISSGTGIFYAVLIAPGFIAVMTAISLSAIEDDLSQFVLLIWSLVSSLIIDIMFLWWYQMTQGQITSFTELTGILFDPGIRLDYITAVLFSSIVVGVFYAGGILFDVPGWMRQQLQRQFHITYNPRQPWENFMRDSKNIRIKTQDNQLYKGDVSEWSRAGRQREVRIENPHQYYPEDHAYGPVGREDMLFLEDDIDRILMREKDTKVRREQSDEEEEDDS